MVNSLWIWLCLMTASAQTRISISKDDIESNTAFVSYTNEVFENLKQTVEGHLQDDISTIRDVREIMKLEDETMTVDKPKVLLIFPEGSSPVDEGIPTKKGQLSEDSEAVVLDFQDNEVSTYFPVLGQKPISPNQDDNLNLKVLLNNSDGSQVEDKSLVLIPMLEISVEQNVDNTDMNSRARKVEDDEKTDFNNDISFDLKDLSTKVQDVVNELLEVPTKSDPNTIIKAIEDKVTLNYPKFDIGVKIQEAAEEGLAVVLNISDKESNEQVKFEQIPLFVIESPSEGSGNADKKEKKNISLPKPFRDQSSNQKAEVPLFEIDVNAIQDATTEQISEVPFLGIDVESKDTSDFKDGIDLDPLRDIIFPVTRPEDSDKVRSKETRIEIDQGITLQQTTNVTLEGQLEDVPFLAIKVEAEETTYSTETNMLSDEVVPTIGQAKDIPDIDILETQVTNGGNVQFEEEIIPVVPGDPNEQILDIPTFNIDVEASLNDIGTLENEVIENVRDMDVGKALEEKDYGSYNTKMVKTLNGKVQGYLETTGDGTEFYKFLGIPYAEPPVDTLRFATPKPAIPWSGILNSSLAGVSCLQSAGSSVSGQENCLIVNVWLPRVNESQLLPVMVWIHGGFFTLGSGNEDFQSPVRFMDYGVIVVTLNYRLGPLGFFSLGDQWQPGNLGLWDQNLALKWVQQNIPMFGGDNTKVTLFGQSAGAMSVHAHILSSQARGLFTGAIMQSGSLLYTSRFRQSSSYVMESSQNLAELLGCKNGTSTQTVLCLQDISGEDLTLRGTFNKGGISREDLLSDPDWAWYPVLDGEYTGKAYIEKDPLETMIAGSFNKVPVITGVVADEGGIYLASIFEDLESVSQVWDLVGPGYLLQIPPGKADQSEITLANTITRFYTGSTNITSASKESLLEMLTDATFLAPNIQTAEALSSAGAKVRSYVLDFEGSYSNTQALLRSGLDETFGVIHGDDLRYLFQSRKNEELLTEDEKKTSQLMLNLWTDFAKASQMNSWPEYSSTGGSFLSIGPNPETRENIFPERMLFWEKLVWEPLTKSISSQITADKKQPTVMVPSTLQYPWPPLIPPIWTRSHVHWTHQMSPFPYTHFHP
eukprot:TRINITY_DN5863_c0_g1_i2.p1 TRINITY_DN5863_c0_g1~~TRINITY_DN5863_c0_g1_i2.p1  ORF type:complete len:1103 (-),score=277.16 TRINITY_DN5863_c0_g1_i2:72-3380(-)